MHATSLGGDFAAAPKGASAIMSGWLQEILPHLLSQAGEDYSEPIHQILCAEGLGGQAGHLC
jgi:hypothetical protein